MSKLNISKGELKYYGTRADDYGDLYMCIGTEEDNESLIGEYGNFFGEDFVSLIADAGNTYNKCGMLPSELLEGNNNGKGWFNSYQSVDNFLFNELGILDLEFPIIDEDKPELNTIEAIKVLTKEIVRLNKLKTKLNR